MHPPFVTLPLPLCFQCRRIAYMVWKGRRGYSWDDIPDLPALQ
jgi:hypothetical protein